MTTTTKLIGHLANLIRSRSATTFYLNGPPGSGKSYLLKELARQLQLKIPRSVSLGPYAVKWAELDYLGNRLIQDCLEMGFLDELPATPFGPDFVSTWHWFVEKAEVRSGQTLLVFIDLVDENQPDLSVMGSLFSSARYLEGAWKQDRLKIHHTFTGYWNHIDLREYYKKIDTSFPYTVGHNYTTWNGLSVNEMIALIEQVRSDEIQPIHGQLLFELTGGHPAAALEILDQIVSGNLNLPALLSATRQAAKTGLAGQALLEKWGQLPDEVRLLLQKLIVKRHVVATAPQSIVDQLLVAGVIQQNRVGEKNYLSFHSWYAELLVRLHMAKLKIANQKTRKIQLNELMPEVSALNIEAYRLINDIENAARNFAAIQLSLQRVNSDHILKGINKQYNHRRDIIEDQYQRATNLQERSIKRGLRVDINPLLAYCYTPELADLIREIGIEIESKPWQNIAQAIEDLSYIRNAVMHNQLIDDLALQELYDLRIDIYEALSETK